MNKSAKKLNLKIVLAAIGVIFLASISFSLTEKFNPVSITAMPEVPKEGQPILITFNLNNPSMKENLINYEFYANGDLLLKGKELISPYSSRQNTYLYPKSPKLGDKITFLVKTESEQGSFDKTLSTPPYPPQILSSFVSFASFSTSLISSSMSSSMTSSITSQQYYNGAFTNNNDLNVGLIVSIVLILLLIYLELTEHLKERTFTTVGGMRIRFSRLSAILFIIFIGMVFTKVAMII
ncbi:MAG: hypothetical protein O8C59_03340 [Candidatus Methanoperedens sp.]|nr:hypothetical protein [Candidatus Methanoperedens sp.]